MSDDSKPPYPPLPPPQQPIEGAAQKAPGPVPTSPEQVQTAACPVCQHQLILKLPQGTPFHHPQGTILFFPHPQPTRCSECGQHYAPVLMGAQGIVWNWQPCPPPAESSRIIPAPRGPIPFQRGRKPQ